MIIYITIFFVIIIGFNYFEKHPCRSTPIKKDKRFILLAGFCFVFVIGLRGVTVGSDTIQYLERYDGTLIRLASGFDNPEIGFDALQFVIKEVLGIGYHGFLFIIALFTIGSLFYVIHKYSKDELVSVFIFVLMLFTMYMSGIRQCTAISVGLWAIVAADKRRPIIFCLLLLVAYFIHNSSVVCIFVYFIWGRNINRMQAFLIFLLTISTFIIRPYLTPYIEIISPAKYEKIDLNSGNSLNFLVLLVDLLMVSFSLISIPVENDLKKRLCFSRNDSFFFIIMCVGLFFQIMSLSNGQLGRLSFYFSIGYFVSMSSALANPIRKGKNMVPIMRLILVILCILYFTISSIGDPTIDYYKFCWE